MRINDSTLRKINEFLGRPPYALFDSEEEKEEAYAQWRMYVAQEDDERFEEAMRTAPYGPNVWIVTDTWQLGGRSLRRGQVIYTSKVKGSIGNIYLICTTKSRMSSIDTCGLDEIKRHAVRHSHETGSEDMVADAARLRLQRRKGRRRAARTASGFASPYSDQERQAIGVIAEAAREKLRKNLEPDAPYESEGWAYRRLEQELVRLQGVEITALAVESAAWTSYRDTVEDIAFKLADKMFDKPGCGIGMEKDLF